MMMVKMMERAMLALETQPEPEPLRALLYFQNGTRLEIVGEQGEIATLNLSTADPYTHALLLSVLCREYGRILIRDEHLARLPNYLHRYFEPTKQGGDER
jgi:hypothetical protein